MSAKAFCLVLLAALSGGTNALSGSVACPCIDVQNTSNYADIQAAIEAAGYPASYGTDGCRKYDAEPGIDPACTGNGTTDPRYCNSAWCYVDVDKCGMNEQQCKAAGLLLNNPTNESCRARGFDPTSIVNSMPLFYSYETCGYLNSYDTGRVFPGLANGDLVVATTHVTPPPYHMVIEHPEPGRTDKEYTGIMIEFFKTSINYISPPPNIIWDDGWATDTSREVYDFSSYTACVHDVAVGNFDMCVGDIWILPERVVLTSFSPPVRYDHFYMAVLDSGPSSDSFAQMMAKPLAPFAWESWYLTLGVIAFAAFVVGITDSQNEDDFPYSPTEFALRCWKSLYLSTSSFLNGVPINANETVPAKIAAIGYNWFILVILASYTANLATILVTTPAYSGISTVEEAIALDYKICIHGTTFEAFNTSFPNADFVRSTGSDWARKMHAGECQVAVMYEQRFDAAWAGELKDSDCKQLAAGELTANEAQCELSDGSERDDCSILKVGNIIMSIGIGFPVRRDLLPGISWGMSKAESAGEWKKWVDRFSSQFSTGTCNGGDDDVERLPIGSFAGTVIQASILMGVALLLAMYEKLSGKRLEELLQSKDSEVTKDDGKLETLPSQDFAAADMVLNGSGRQDDNLGKVHPTETIELGTSTQVDQQALLKAVKATRKNQLQILQKLDELLGESTEGIKRATSDESHVQRGDTQSSWITDLFTPLASAVATK